MDNRFTVFKSFPGIIFLTSALLLFIELNIQGQANPVIKHLSRLDGLSNNRVVDITQDRTGFIWIATENGLNRYDGVEFKHYLNTNNKFNISKLFMDSSGNLWACSLGGRIYKYDYHSDTFVHINSKTELSGFSYISVIHEDADSTLWFGTDKGLYSYNPENGQTHHWISQDKNPNSLTNNNITDILEDNNGNLWISTYVGLNFFNTRATRFEAITANDRLSQLNGDLIYDIEFHGNHHIALGTSGAGMLTYNIKDDTIEAYPLQKCLQEDGIVRTIFKDSKNTTWIGTDGNGLIRVQESSGTPYVGCFNKDGSISGNTVYKVFEDVDHNIWIGTAWNGISIIPSELEGIMFLSSGDGSPPVLSINAISDRIWYGSDGFGLKKGFEGNLYEWEKVLVSLVQDKYIQCIYPDSKGAVWIGTFANGLLKFDTAARTSQWISTDTRSKLSLSFNDVRGVREDSLGNYWVTTAGGGLHYLRLDRQKVVNFKHGRNNPCSIGSDNIQSFIMNKDGSLWLATYGGGLDYYNYSRRCFEHFVFDSLNTASINSNYVFSLMDDNKGNLWIGTSEGLCKMDLAAKEITRLDLKGLKTGIITSMQPDDNGNIWISSRNGIFYYDPENDRFSQLTQLNEEYHLGASYKDKDGKLKFGGMKGVTSFYPNQLRNQETRLPIVITDIKLFNEPIEPLTTSGPESLKHSQLIFEYYESVITFDFSALYYPSSSKIEYAVKMDNFDQEWRSIGNQRSATYTNLSPGEYQFRVRANLPGAEFSESLPVKLVILAPIWKRWWAYVLYIVVFVLVLWMIIRYTQIMEKMKGDLNVEKLKREQEKQLHKIKQRFFTNVSHEIRTPVTLLLGAVNSLLENTNLVPEDETKFSAIQINSRRLLKLVNELLDLRKLERKKVSLKVEQVDLVAYCHDIFLSFNHRARNRNVDYRFCPNADHIMVWIDKDEMEKVMYNLLSNAFKYLPDGGKITVELKEFETAVQLTVSDTGKGIPPQHLSKVFKRFYHIDTENDFSKEGFGLGLAITSEIVNLHEGEISVSSTAGKGTSFTVKLLKGNSHFSRNIILENDVPMDDIYKSDNKTLSQSAISNLKGSQVLVVDDNSEIRDYLKELLEYEFNVTLAENGQKAWELVSTELPDLVISDVVMPELDGISFAKKLKENSKTSHIPIILLTARGSDDYHRYSLEIGADDFVTKPFDEDLLRARILNLLNNRYRIKEKIRNELILNPREITGSSSDQQFLKQLISILDSNISQGEFSVASLSKNLGMSHSIVYKKLKALTGYNLVEFIRDYRLKKAAQLLTSGEVSVKEACFAVGFSDRKYFGAMFKKKFGTNPSDYRKDPQRKTDITRIP